VGERRDDEPQADAATGQVIDPSYEEEPEEESGSVEGDRSSSNASQ
jgi:hypothetical protein